MLLNNINTEFIMNIQNRIEELYREIESLKKEQSKCNHAWNDAIYDPEKIMVSDDRKGYETHGSDIWPVPLYHEEQKDRWSRECSNCGLKQYTYKNEVVVTKRQPKF